MRQPCPEGDERLLLPEGVLADEQVKVKVERFIARELVARCVAGVRKVSENLQGKGLAGRPGGNIVHKVGNHAADSGLFLPRVAEPREVKHCEHDQVLNLLDELLLLRRQLAAGHVGVCALHRAYALGSPVGLWAAFAHAQLAHLRAVSEEGDKRWDNASSIESVEHGWLHAQVLDAFEQALHERADLLFPKWHGATERDFRRI
mmetsp:Transcript_4360/g.12600  ORF Transcript_4360/g.12600 Transcript_4360/m.12600 type:complete len:204 (+) Transcript_4360:587-1198(+)